MKRFLILFIALFVAGLAFAQIKTCYDVQFTEAATGDSPYKDQVVTVEGIVVAEKFYTGTNTSNYGFIISDPNGGPWSGLLIFTNRYFPLEGDKVQVTGTITEYYNLTEMTSLTDCVIVSSGNTLPTPPLVTTGALTSAATGEQWESCFVKLEELTVTAAPNNYLEFYVTDGSGASQIDDQCFPRSGFSWPTITVGANWAKIQGVVDYSFNYYAVNPRKLSDLVQVDNVSNATVRIPSSTVELEDNFNAAIKTSKIKLAWGISSYSTTIKIDPAKLEFLGITNTGTITSMLPDNVEISEDGTEISISYISQEPIVSTAEEADLLFLQFKAISYGEAMIEILNFSYDTTPLTSIYGGKISVPVRERIAWLNIGNQNNGRNIFNPALNEKLVIEYGSKVGTSGVNSKVIVRIYDGKGRLVATPVNKVIASAMGFESFVYDGRDSSLNLLSPGLYYCSLEIVERETGRKDRTLQPIVVKSELK